NQARTDRPTNATGPQRLEKFRAQWIAFACPPCAGDRDQSATFRAWEGGQARADLARAGLLEIAFPAIRARWQYQRLMADLCKQSNLYRALAGNVAWQLGKFKEIGAAVARARRVGESRRRGMPSGRLRNEFSSHISALPVLESRIGEFRKSVWRLRTFEKLLRDAGRATGPARSLDINGWFQRVVFRSLDWYFAPGSRDSILVKRRTLVRLVILTYFAADLAKCRGGQVHLAVTDQRHVESAASILDVEHVERNLRGLRPAQWHPA